MKKQSSNPKGKVTSQIKGQNNRVHYGYENREKLCQRNTFLILLVSCFFVRTTDPTSELMFRRKQIRCSAYESMGDIVSLILNDNPRGLQKSYRDQQTVRMIYSNFILPRFPACMHAKSLQSCLTFCDPMDCNLPGFSVHGILQARILEWVAMSSSSESS